MYVPTTFADHSDVYPESGGENKRLKVCNERAHSSSEYARTPQRDGQWGGHLVAKITHTHGATRAAHGGGRGWDDIVPGTCTPWAGWCTTNCYTVGYRCCINTTIRALNDTGFRVTYVISEGTFNVAVTLPSLHT